jgi:hypothetical protein
MRTVHHVFTIVLPLLISKIDWLISAPRDDKYANNANSRKRKKKKKKKKKKGPMRSG